MECCEKRDSDSVKYGSRCRTFIIFASCASPRERQQSFAIMCIATPLANERVTFPLYTGQIAIAILVVLEGFVESGKADALEHYSCFHGAKVIRFF